MEEIIKVEHLTKSYQEERGIFNFSFTVKKGQAFGLVGTNGSGKTTTIRHMMGFIKEQEGKVTIAGMDAWKDAAKIKRIVGYVPGQIDFPDVGTGKDFLKIQIALLGMKDLTYMNELIDRLKIDISAPLKRMSKGMKQKMALVAAFMSEPDIYLLDEPSTGLDPLMRDTMIEIILEQKEKGKTIFMSSHIFRELEQICDAVLFIHNGHIVDQVGKEEFRNNPREQYTIRFATQEDYQRFLKWDYIIGNDRRKREVSVSIPVSYINELFEKLKTYDVEALDNDAYTLEKYYIENVENREETAC